MSKTDNQSKTNGCASSNNVKIFFDQEWDLYKRVITLNYMAHKEILGHLSEFFSSVPPPMFSVLELGCGDASLLSSALQGTDVETYCGVDISPFALENAKKNMQFLHGDRCTIEGDLLDEVGKIEAEFDVIVAGFSLHHLMKEEKGQFFKRCRTALKPLGILIVFDEVCFPGENRNGFFKRFSEICMQEWNKFTHEELLLICEHVENSDYPETFDFYKQFAEKNGFGESQILFQDKHNLYGLFRFST